ncbi:hypothetical protein AVEN_6943-1 [Araneus ventricosus]|uniref:Uncharacterized protein n=1 Tax=Araneus ventricosus TaxID=182803 RepID=A0A4Y2REH6_ARAVE|nr:hypothetical protein AVEN_6943-1 [Araneus ventricosus]
MRNAVWAIYFHTRSTDNESVHSFCPAGETSWCKYNQAVLKGTAETFRHKNSLPPAVMDAIKPILNSLTHPELLNRCLGAYTQNANESLKSVIWQICPKISGSTHRIAEIDVYESVVRFNEGRLGRLKIMKELELCMVIMLSVLIIKLTSDELNRETEEPNKIPSKKEIKEESESAP